MNASDQPVAESRAGTAGTAPNADPRFVQYYQRESATEGTRGRAKRIKDRIEILLKRLGPWPRQLRVADIGCGAGAHATLWAEDGHTVSGADVSQPLIEIARERAKAGGLPISFDVASATALPYENATFDVCILPELLEHIADWEACLREAIRVLRVGGVLYVSTTNLLCPVQEEFNLPLYSWYPGFLKRHYERLSVTTRPELVQYSSFPAVHWFTYYGLRGFLARYGMRSYDRFDLFESPAQWKRGIAAAVAAVPPLKFAAQFVVPSCLIYAVKER